MSEPTTRTVQFRMAPPGDIRRRCEDANRALLQAQWRMDDLYAEQDADQIVIDESDLANWRTTLKAANAALALAAAMLGQIDG